MGRPKFACPKHFQKQDRIYSGYKDVFNEKETKRNHKSRKRVGNLYQKKNADRIDNMKGDVTYIHMPLSASFQG